LQPIGFLCDHVEILYDIDIAFREYAAKLGMRLERPESLNASPILTQALAKLARESFAETMSAKRRADRVVIVGAGPGGLASAMLLAKAGLKSRWLRSAARWVGAPRRWSRMAFKFDVGPTFFSVPQVLREIFAATGHSWKKKCRWSGWIRSTGWCLAAAGKVDATPMWSG
jgi:hypothetical protein